LEFSRGVLFFKTHRNVTTRLFELVISEYSQQSCISKQSMCAISSNMVPPSGSYVPLRSQTPDHENQRGNSPQRQSLLRDPFSTVTLMA